MAEMKPTDSGGQRYSPYVPSGTSMKEFTVRALAIGLVLSVVLGAANAYLGAKAGMTIAATYPAAVLSMAILRFFRGSILEENMARTVGSIGESVAAGAVFTIPAFILSDAWKELHYLESAAIMLLGGVVGIFFVTILRRVMVEDRDLPYPESIAAAEIHKAGRSGGTGAIYLLAAGALGAVIEAFKQVSLFAEKWSMFVPFSPSSVKLLKSSVSVPGSGGMLLSTPAVSPAYMGVGYIIGPKLASLNFGGGLLAWGLFVPLLLFILGPTTLESGNALSEADWTLRAEDMWKAAVRPIAIGGMLVSACYTLWRMRKNLVGGLRRSIGDVKKAAGGESTIERTERDLRFNWVLGGIAACTVLTFFLGFYFTGKIGSSAAVTVVMVIAGFFFAAVSGYLVGMIGSSNNPISGLTLSTVIIAALLMLILDERGLTGLAAVLGIAGVICVSAAVAGEMLQDLKVGHILGGTPWKMQVGDLIGVLVSALVMFFALLILHEGYKAKPDDGIGFGGPTLSCPQASLMAMVSKGIVVAGDMPWPLIIVGMLMAVGFILLQVRSPMLLCVGMYLPLNVTFAIFIGGVIRGVVDLIGERRKFNAAQKARAENTGILLASGLIAGEALIGLVFTSYEFFKTKKEDTLLKIFDTPSFIPSLFVFLLIAVVLAVFSLRTARKPDEPAPPSAIV